MASAAGPVQTRESSPVRGRRSINEPTNQPTNQPTLTLTFIAKTYNEDTFSCLPGPERIHDPPGRLGSPVYPDSHLYTQTQSPRSFGSVSIVQTFNNPTVSRVNLPLKQKLTLTLFLTLTDTGGAVLTLMLG